MSPQQAFVFLKQMLIAKNGITIDECAMIAEAWNLVWNALSPKPEPKPEPRPEEKNEVE